MTWRDPTPETIAMLAHMPWITDIIGVVSKITHSIE